MASHHVAESLRSHQAFVARERQKENCTTIPSHQVDGSGSPYVGRYVGTRASAAYASEAQQTIQKGRRRHESGSTCVGRTARLARVGSGAASRSITDAAARIRTWEPLRDETLNLAPFPSLATAARHRSLADVEKGSRGGKVTWPPRPSCLRWPSRPSRSTRRRISPTSACSSRKASARST